MADHPLRSTGNRRAVRNALFRSMMGRCKLRESDLYRIKYVDEGPARITTFGPPRYDDPPNAYGARLDLCETYGRGYSPPLPPPEPHPWVRLWRRLVWGA